MKRYRICNFDFDSRASLLDDIPEIWDDKVKELHIKNRNKLISNFILEFGKKNIDIKLQNLKDLGDKPFSILAFHNKFLKQIRNAFISKSYYPALTSACALGERILNHLIINLKEFYKNTKEYKKVYKKNSFDNWDLAIEILNNWDVLLPDTIKYFNELKIHRNKAIHFNPDTDNNDRILALDSIKCLTNIINKQFSAVGNQPWFFIISGEIYIKKEWENSPFIQTIYLKNCRYVGYKHKIDSIIPCFIINDNFDYENKELTDEEFSTLRKNFYNIK